MKLSHVKLNEVNEKKCKMKLELKWSDMKVNKGTNTWSGLVYWMKVTPREWSVNEFNWVKFNEIDGITRREARTDEFTFSEEPLRAENEFIQPQFTLTLHSHCVNVWNEVKWMGLKNECRSIAAFFAHSMNLISFH